MSWWKDVFSFGSGAFSVVSQAYSAKIYKHEDDLTLSDTSKEGIKPEDANPSEVLTKPERWVKDKGRLGKIANRLFSPTFSRGLSLISIILLFFSPVGFIFGAIAVSVTGAMFLYEIIRDTNKYRNLKTLQEKRAIFEEIHNIETQINKICQGNPKLAALDAIIHNIDLDNKLQGKNIDSASTIAGKSTAKKTSIPIIERVPESAVYITASALALNPVALGLATAGAILGTGTNYAQKNAYWRMKNKLVNHINDTDIQIDRNASIPDLRMKLEARQHQLEIFQKLEQECRQNPDLDAGKRYQFLISDHHQELQRKFNYPKETSYLSDLGTTLKAGNSWTGFSRLYTPMLNTHAHHYQSSNQHTTPIAEPKVEKQETKHRTRHHDLSKHSSKERHNKTTNEPDSTFRGA